MRIADPVITKVRLEAFTALARFWLDWVMGAIARIAPINGSRRMRFCVARTERMVEHVLFLAAAAHLAPPPGRHRTPRSAPPGFRNARRGHALFFKRAKIRLHGATLAQRLAYISRALASPARIIVRIAARLRRGIGSAQLVAAAPPASNLRTQTRGVMIAALDTS